MSVIFVCSPLQAHVRLPDAGLERITCVGARPPPALGNLWSHLSWGTPLSWGGGTPRQSWATKPGPLLSRTRGCPHDQNHRTRIDQKVELVSIPQNCRPVGPTRGPGPTPDPANETVGLESGVCVPDDSSGTDDQVNLGML